MVLSRYNRSKRKDLQAPKIATKNQATGQTNVSGTFEITQGDEEKAKLVATKNDTGVLEDQVDVSTLKNKIDYQTQIYTVTGVIKKDWENKVRGFKQGVVISAVPGWGIT